MEDVNGLSSVFGTLHCGPSIPGTRATRPPVSAAARSPARGCQTGFHTYAVEWDRSVSPETLRWYRDGAVYFRQPNQVDADVLDQRDQPRLLRHPRPGHRRRLPGRVRRRTRPRPPAPAYRCWSTTSRSTRPAAADHRPPPPPPTTAARRRPARTARSRPSRSTPRAARSRETTTDAGGGQDMGFIANGDWAQYANVDFGSTAAHQFSARVASGAAGGVSGLVEVRLDSRTNAPIGSFAIANTGGWQSWRTVPANISAVTGVHTVFLTLHQRPAGRLRQRQLVHLRALGTGTQRHPTRAGAAGRQRSPPRPGVASSGQSDTARLELRLFGFLTPYSL